MATLVLGRDGMGPNSDEADFQDFVGYVTDCIDKRCDFVVDVERRQKRDVQSNAVFDATDEEEDLVMEAAQELWNEWCAEGAPVGAGRTVAKAELLLESISMPFVPSAAASQGLDSMLLTKRGAQATEIQWSSRAIAARAVTTYAPGGSGGRASGYQHEGLQVLVTPPDEESTEAAFDYACELSRSAIVIDDLRGRLEAMTEKARALRLLVKPDPVRLLGTGCVRFRNGDLWLLNSRREGWSAFGVTCKGWDELFRRYNVGVTATGNDTWGEWWEVENLDQEAVEAIQRTAPVQS